MGKSKASTGGLSALVEDFGMTGIIGALVIYVIFKIKTRLGSADATVNTTFDTAIEGPSEIIGWLPILAVVIMAFLAVRYFKGGQSG